MNFNLINNLEICRNLVDLYTPVSVVYYSHIPVVILALLLGFFIFLKSKEISVKIILILSVVFSGWSLIDIILWTSTDSQKYMFFWSLTPMLEILLFILGIYLINVFISKKDLNIKNKVFLFLPFLPILILTSTTYNISYFNISECIPTDHLLYPFYALPLRGILALLLIINFIYLFKKIDKEKRFQLVLMFSGLFLFLVSFFSSNYLVNYLINNEIMTYGDAYQIEMYSLFTFPIFLGLLAFIIVRFKAFNIKLLGAQALVWALIILVGAQFLYLNEMPTTSIVLTSITLVLSTLMGLLVVRSVKKVDTQRELLDIANKNQQSLIHFITHQVKGYLTKSRNIFDGMIAGDYDPISDKALQMAKHGFESDTKGVETVISILKASDLKTGQTTFTKEKTNISALVAEIIEDKKESAIQKGLEFSFEIEPNIEITVDQLQIKEVLKNIITNSILYTQKGTVHVVLKRESGKVKFSVIDTGVGLSAQDKKRLFTEGGKGEESSLVNVDSTGYGLYIAKQIVEQHEGIIEAVSEGRGKGSEFFVILPDVR